MTIRTDRLSTYRLPLRVRLVILWRRLTRQAIPYKDTWA